MAAKKEEYSTDIFEKSNLSSLHSDHSSTHKSNKLNCQNSNLHQTQNCFCQQHIFDNAKFIPCHTFNSNHYPNHFHQCFCQKLQLNDLQKPTDSVTMPNEWQNFKWKWPRQNYANKKDKSCHIKSKCKRYFYSEKPVSCCEMIEGIPRRNAYELENIENPIKHLDLRDKKEISEKIEIYYFDHGNSAYYCTTDVAPILLTDKFAEKSNSAATRFWAEIFGYVHIGASFLTVFLLQFLRCILFSLVRPLTVGVIQLIADYFIKPILSITFNGILQPILILFYNVATSLRDCCEPIAAALAFFIKEIALLFRSCRLIEITHNHINNANT